MSTNADAGSMATQTLVKPLVAAGIAGLAANYVLPGVAKTFNVSLIGKDVPSWMAASGAVFLGSLAADVLQQYIVADSSAVGYTAGMLAGPLLTGAATSAAFLVMNKNSLGAAGMQIFALGAGSEIAGKYAFDAVIGPYLNKTDV